MDSRHRKGIRLQNSRHGVPFILYSVSPVWVKKPTSICNLRKVPCKFCYTVSDRLFSSYHQALFYHCTVFYHMIAKAKCSLSSSSSNTDSGFWRDQLEEEHFRHTLVSLLGTHLLMVIIFLFVFKCISILLSLLTLNVLHFHLSSQVCQVNHPLLRCACTPGSILRKALPWNLEQP